MSYMKRILSLFALLLVSVIGFAQAPSNYTNINGRYRWIAGMFDSTFSLPKGTTPSLRTGGSTNGGALFYRTSDSTVKYWTGTQWLTLSDSTRYVPYIGAIKDVDLDTWSLNAKSLHVKGTAGNGHVGLKFQSATPNMSANETGLYADASGNFGIKIDNAHTSIFKTSLNTADRTYTFQNKSYTVADSADVAAKIGGTLISGYLTKATGTNTIGNSQIFDNGTSVGINTASPSATYKLDVNGEASINGVRVGRGAGSVSTNTAVGASALNANTIGSGNAAFGTQSLLSNTIGYENSAVGVFSLLFNTEGYDNTAMGMNALRTNTTGHTNSAFGVSALYNNTLGFGNSAVGINSLNSNTTGYNNTAVGINSGRYTNAGGANETSYNSVYLGFDTRASASGNTNEIVIGVGVLGGGSNTVTLGNSSILNTYLKGQANVATINNATTDTDKFLVSDGGTIKYRTGAEVLSDIGGQAALTNPVTGTGTTNYIPKFTSSSAIGNSVIQDDGSTVTITSLTKNVGEFRIYPSSGTAILRFGSGSTEKGKLSVDISSNMIFETANSERMRLDASGNLGLGVTPSAWGSTIRAIQANNASLYGVTTDNSNATIAGNAYYDGTGFKYIATQYAQRYTQSGGQHLWFTAPSGTAGNAISFTQAMTLDASGRLGIGTTSPDAKLQVQGTASSSAFLRFGRYSGYSGGLEFRSYTGSGGWDIKTSTDVSNVNLVFSRSEGTGNYVFSDANVGIGTTSPASYTGYTTLALNNATNGGLIDFMAAGSVLAQIYATTSYLSVGSFTNMPVRFMTNNAEVARFNSSGELLINTTTDAGDYKLQVNGNVYSAGQYFSSKVTNLSTISNTPLNASLLLYAPTTTGYYGGIIGWAEGNIATSISAYDDGTGGALGLVILTGNNTTISEALRISSTQNATFAGSIKTAAPSGYTAKPWKLGDVSNTTVSLDTTRYISVDIDGTVYYIALVNLN